MIYKANISKLCVQKENERIDMWGTLIILYLDEKNTPSTTYWHLSRNTGTCINSGLTKRSRSTLSTENYITHNRRGLGNHPTKDLKLKQIPSGKLQAKQENHEITKLIRFYGTEFWEHISFVFVNRVFLILISSILTETFVI